MDPVRLRAERWQARSVAIGMLLLGSLYLGLGVKAHNFVKNSPEIDSHYRTKEAGLMPYVYAVEGSGALAIAAGLAAAYGARRITRQLRESE